MKVKCRKPIGRKLVYLLIVALVFGYFGFTPVYGATATNFKDVLSDSRPSTDANHSVYFATPTGVDDPSDTITITLDSGFDASSTVYSDIDLEIDEACDGVYEIAKTLAATATSSTWGAAVSGQVLTLTAPTDAISGEIAAAACVLVEMGTNADSGTNQITNPTAGVYDIDVGGTFGDSNKTKVAIVDGVTVTVTIPSILLFQVAAVTGASCPLTATIDSSATAIAFGTVDEETFYRACQKLRIGTNAQDGYSVTVQKTQLLTNASADTIPKGTGDGSVTDTTAAAWANVVGADDDTNDGFGYCMDDYFGDGAGTAEASWAAGINDCGAAIPYFKTIAIQGTDTPQSVMSSATLALDSSYVEYQLNVSPDQPEGSYTTTIVYVATPQFD